MSKDIIFFLINCFQNEIFIGLGQYPNDLRKNILNSSPDLTSSESPTELHRSVLGGFHVWISLARPPPHESSECQELR